MSEKPQSPLLKPKQKWKRVYWWVVYVFLGLGLIQAIRYGADPQILGAWLARTVVVALVLYGILWLVMRAIQGRR